MKRKERIHAHNRMSLIRIRTPWSLLRMVASFSTWICIISFCLLVSCTSSLMPFFFLISCNRSRDNSGHQRVFRTTHDLTRLDTCQCRGHYRLELQLKYLLLVRVGLVLSLDVALLGAFLLGAADHGEGGLVISIGQRSVVKLHFISFSN